MSNSKAARNTTRPSSGGFEQNRSATSALSSVRISVSKGWLSLKLGTSLIPSDVMSPMLSPSTLR